MKLIDLLKREDLCKYRKEAEVRLKTGRIKINNLVVKENIDLNIKEVITVDEWLTRMNFSIFQWRCLFFFCTPPIPSNGISGIDYVFDKSELWKDPIILKRLPFLHLVNEDKLKLLQIAKRDKFILI